MDLKNCVAGRNELGQWHIACDEEGAPALMILMDMKYTGVLSSLGITYFQAARWVCAHGGITWTTNALGVPTSAPLPPVDPF
jgi:hypothetical protein